MAKKEEFIQLKPPNLCHSLDEFKRKQLIFIRDMSLRKIKPTFKRKDGLIYCVETGDCWRILGSSWREYERKEE
jgi:hypothetical protein